MLVEIVLVETTSVETMSVETTSAETELLETTTVEKQSTKVSLFQTTIQLLLLIGISNLFAKCSMAQYDLSIF